MALKGGNRVLSSGGGSAFLLYWLLLNSSILLLFSFFDSCMYLLHLILAAFLLRGTIHDSRSPPRQ
ncbi:hypothetical protein EJ08DRAFT_5281 [Tothia fuscella]|uniref:Uncharacterized protein n=1 Tax=Tothia fuscella TaxID=1048955 RepID=A0A9P4P426_9PEZI|nr:hypothetical protein EJ08DRAFT_5281 [Tothia fuscella]